MQSAKLKRAKLPDIIKISQYTDDTYNNDLRRIEAFLSRTFYLLDTFALACGFKVNYETLFGVLGIRDNRTNNLGIKAKRATNEIIFRFH